MKKLLLLAAIVLLGLCAYVGTKPYTVMQSIQTAIKNRDADTLNSHIDFDALRQNIKAQYFTRGTGSGNGESSLAGRIASGVAKRMVSQVQNTAVDALVRPITVSAILKGQEIPELKPIIGQTIVPLDTEAPLSNSRTTYDSFSQFSIWNQYPTGQQVRIVLERQGIDWKVTNVKMY